MTIVMLSKYRINTKTPPIFCAKCGGDEIDKNPYGYYVCRKCGAKY